MNLNQRLKKIEAKQKFTRPSKEQVERQLNNLLAANGLNREAAAIKYGSVGAFCHALLLKVDKKADSVPTTGHLPRRICHVFSTPSAASRSAPRPYRRLMPSRAPISFSDRASGPPPWVSNKENWRLAFGVRSSSITPALW